ncbi:MAG TPA: pyridoxal-dependent decarboxylase [Polyangiaceae bacterium]
MRDSSALMTLDSGALRSEMEVLVARLGEALGGVLLSADERPVFVPGAEAALANFHQPLPERGCGAAETLEQLLRLNHEAGANTNGPRCFHFVIGGTTPAAQAADLLATAFDAMAYSWVLTPVAVQMERQALDWLKEMFGLPESFAGVMVTGATMANFTCLAAARQWWGEAQGFDVSEVGLGGAPPLPVFSSGLVHASTLKALAMLGIGRGQLRRFASDGFGRVDLAGLSRALDELRGNPAVVVVNAGEVNAGEFDPVEAMIALARKHNSWVHVDGAFGLFAKLSPRTEHLVDGVGRADSVTVDGHKWLNVPYDSGYAFVRDHGLLGRAFRYSADYLPVADTQRPTPGALGPESSRRARSFAVWATLKAYGRAGQQAIVEHCLDLAQHFAAVVKRTPGLELMREPGLNIVPFRFNPGQLPDDALDQLNQRLGEIVLGDGRFMVGTSKLGQRTVFRPAFSNWRTRTSDVEAFAEVIVELGRRLELA